ncbi:hypothetical protein L873DRAFT_871275 [Choiromyces venosus 120613-1]|uniref:Uncharacterized protein n=1 Tax=Choiromyces venosus 120613-1 TaxID=1336337 RepID=A0A3N4JU11_9PEZI|nr:hypothetical protein L873DRAFT_871275 [Choiromyces venosus 120613-1]
MGSPWFEFHLLCSALPLLLLAFRYLRQFVSFLLPVLPWANRWIAIELISIPQQLAFCFPFSLGALRDGGFVLEPPPSLSPSHACPCCMVPILQVHFPGQTL